MAAMNDLERYFASNTGRVIHKWHHYFDIYDRHFSRFRGRPITVVEIGVYKGGSLQMWKQYFGPHAHIVGIDIDPSCISFTEEQIEIVIGNQEDRGFLRSLRERLPAIDILIDDGGHTMKQQIVTFEELFPHVASEGVYLCEDLHTSYWKEYGGGYRRAGSFIEYSKHFIDRLNAWHARRVGWPFGRKLEVSDFTKSVDSLHFYDSVLVIEKRPRTKPVDSNTGREQ
jgi:hypothetical protein